jgi:MraZ protein
MLLGTHEHTLDDKNRLTLPARLREELGDRVVVMRGMDGCLYVYPAAGFDRLADRLLGLDGLSVETRKLQRHFFTGASPAELDRQGRMVIPAGLLMSAGIERDVTVAGVHDHLEIWARAAWLAQERDFEGSAEDVAERLANRD